LDIATLEKVGLKMSIYHLDAATLGKVGLKGVSLDTLTRMPPTQKILSNNLRSTS